MLLRVIKMSKMGKVKVVCFKRKEIRGGFVHDQYNADCFYVPDEDVILYYGMYGFFDQYERGEAGLETTIGDYSLIDRPEYLEEARAIIEHRVPDLELVFNNLVERFTSAYPKIKRSDVENWVRWNFTKGLGEKKPKYFMPWDNKKGGWIGTINFSCIREFELDNSTIENLIRMGKLKVECERRLRDLRRDINLEFQDVHRLLD